MWSARLKIDTGRGAWLALTFLALGVVAPTVCILWFMNEAARAQADAAKQSVAEAYRGQLRFLGDRLDASWTKRLAAIDEAARHGQAYDFAHAVKIGLVDSVVLPHYPAAGAVNVDPRALAAQQQIRTLVHTDKSAALRAIGEHFGYGQFGAATDSDGRLIVADEQLLALRLTPPGDASRPAILRHLVTLLNNYDRAMPAAQRLFLMDEVRGIAPSASFPTLEAERLAAQFIESGDPRPAAAGLQPTRIPDVWQMPTKTGHFIALYRTSSVLAASRAILSDGGKGVRFDLTPPGVRTLAESAPAGPMLPGWQLSISVTDPKLMEQAARGRMASYLWAGYLVIALMATTGLVAGGFFRKQMRLARLKTDLVAAVSHELKTPLSSMRLLVDSLLADDEPDVKKTREYLQLMASENMRLTRLVENFLTFARIERGAFYGTAQRFDFHPIDPAEVAASAAGIVRERFQGAGGGEFRVDVDPGLPRIHADSDALLTALVNLLDNAYKYTPTDKRIGLCVYSDSGEVVFAVEDNGIGIAAREQKRIFRRFYQVDTRLARETGGCGLGLSIVDSIVRAHGGSVRVTSSPGSGSTFRVCLPCRT
jgi:signal transduction histidine kinase